MSELVQKHDDRIAIRQRMLAGASALVLASFGSSASIAKSEDVTHPQIWLELDGQFSHQDADVELYSPPFMPASPFDGMSHLDIEKPASTVWDKGAKITFQPDGSDWILTLAARYGKASRSVTRDAHPPVGTKYSGLRYSAYQHFSARSSEAHLIVDFQAGKDVGLGRFGNNGSSTISAGVRIVKFNSRSNANVKSQPTNVPTASSTFSRFYASFASTREFKGVGPALSWNASAIVAGDPADSAISLDWGVNAAVLFGRQKTSSHHQTTNHHFYCPYYCHHISTPYQTAKPAARNKSVTVPNLGGLVGLSWRTSDAKLSLGYRADVFFGAIDGGIDTRKTENRGFFGPFASISIRLGR